MSKISALTEGTSIVATDLFRFVDVSDTTMAASGTNKKATATNVAAGLFALNNLYFSSNTIAQRNGTNAQEFQLFNTYDGTNNEWGFLKWDSNVLKIGTAKSGTGTNRDLLIESAGGAIYTSDYLQVGTGTGGWVAIGNGATTYFRGTINFIASACALTSTVTLGLSTSVTDAPDITLSRLSAGVMGVGTGSAGETDGMIRGKLSTDTNATAGTITADKYLILYDATGTAYRVPCVAD